MSQSPPPIVYILILLVLASGIWAFRRDSVNRQRPSTPDQSPKLTTGSISQVTSGSDIAARIPALIQELQPVLPNPDILKMDGSVTMVRLVLAVKAVFQQNSLTPMSYGVPDGKPNGSNRGMSALLNKSIDLAASSRPLTATEVQAGIIGIPVAKDGLAIVVGVENPFKGGLTSQQVSDIYQGKITNWSQVGGPDQPIHVYNRSPDSGAYDAFKSIVMLGESFAPDGPFFTTFKQDVTTPILRALKANGIGYTTVDQAVGQQTIRIVPIDGVIPSKETILRGSYPLSRVVFLAVPRQTSSAAIEFVRAVFSESGQQVISRTGFIPFPVSL
jgi:phosphate transport system substrate-binding protein